MPKKPPKHQKIINHVYTILLFGFNNHIYVEPIGLIQSAVHVTFSAVRTGHSVPCRGTWVAGWLHCDSPELSGEPLPATVRRCPSQQEPDPTEGYGSRGAGWVPIQSSTWGKVKPSVSECGYISPKHKPAATHGCFLFLKTTAKCCLIVKLKCLISKSNNNMKAFPVQHKWLRVYTRADVCYVIQFCNPFLVPIFKCILLLD